MTTSMVATPGERRRAWAVICTLSAGLAAAAAYGVQHAYAAAQDDFNRCVAAAAGTCRAPGQPVSVWMFAGGAVALVVLAAGLLISAGRASGATARSVPLPSLT